MVLLVCFSYWLVSVLVVIELLMFNVVWFMLISGLMEINSVIRVIGRFIVGSIISAVKVVLLLILVMFVELMVIILISVVIYIGFSGLMLIVGVIIIVSIVGYKLVQLF